MKIKLVEESAAVRALWLFGAVVVTAFVIIWNMMTPAGHSALMLKATWWVGAFSPAILIGAAAGWLKYSRKTWAWTTGVLAFGTLTVIMMVSL